MQPQPAQGQGQGQGPGYHTNEPPPRTDLWWDRLPSLKILRPPKGVFSPQVDERCFTYCSQSITGRIHGATPWCRSLCLRRVFPHEVSRVLAVHRSQSITNVPGKKPIVNVQEHVDSIPVNHALPPEGQRYSGWLAMLLNDHDHDHDHNPDSDPTLPHQHPQNPSQNTDTKYWKQGWYLWWSTSSWAVQEKLDVMRRDLEGQKEWQQFKDKKNDDWAKGIPFDDLPSPQNDSLGHTQSDSFGLEDLGNTPPFPDISSQTILLPLPTLPTTFAAFAPVLSPADRVLALVQESVQSGSQRELWERIWEKAKSDEPGRLLGVAWERVMENFFGEKGSGKS